jgi:hypothetical protein
LDVATTGRDGVALITDQTFPTPVGARQLIINTGSMLDAGPLFSINFDTNGSLDIKQDANLRLQNRLPDAVPGALCGGDVLLIQGDNRGPITCTFPPS